MGAAAIDRNADEISRLVARIKAMGQGELEAAWAMHCRGKPPASLPRSLLARLLAHKVQVDALGDLAPAVQRFLDRVGREIAAGKPPNLQFGEASRLKPGTVLVREHDGAEHRVMVLAEGFAWNGQVHKSLSAFASAITGTRWNGHRFFGLHAASRTKGANPASRTDNVHVSAVSP